MKNPGRRQRLACHRDGDPAASAKSMASSVGSRRSLEGKHKGPTLQGVAFSVARGELVGICGQVLPLCPCLPFQISCAIGKGPHHAADLC